MRIAYIAPYQGPGLVKSRPIVRNHSLAGSVKIELIAGLLSSSFHPVEIISQGEVIELKCRFYPSFCEPERFHPDIPISYSSALPIRFLNSLWASIHTLHLFKVRHRLSPYDLVIIYNLKLPQVLCANYAIHRLGLPVIFEYEDDAFVDIAGNASIKVGLAYRFRYGREASRLLTEVSGCMAASPHLLAQLPSHIPKLLLRGVVGNDLLKSSEQKRGIKENWVLFSGTHYRTKGIEQLITAWQTLQLSDWELHITGYGELTNTLRKMAENSRSIVFRGLVNRQELVRLMCSAKICINPHDVSQTPGNVFAFKIIEYLAAGAHVITTPMGTLEKEIECGITYMPNNNPDTIAATLKQVILGGRWRQTAAQYVCDLYGPAAVSKALDMLLQHPYLSSSR